MLLPTLKERRLSLRVIQGVALGVGGKVPQAGATPRGQFRCGERGGAS